MFRFILFIKISLNDFLGVLRNIIFFIIILRIALNYLSTTNHVLLLCCYFDAVKWNSESR